MSSKMHPIRLFPCRVLPPLLSSSCFRPQLALPTTSSTSLTPLRPFGIKSITRPKPSRYNNQGPDLPALQASAAAALQRKLNADTIPLRAGAIAIKRGMTVMYDTETSDRIPCTVLQLDRVEVIANKTVKKHGYFAVQIGAGWRHHTNIDRALLGHFSASKVSPKRHVCEFRVRDEDGLLPVGHSITADWFLEGQFVDTRSKTKGKGFQGAMKRHGFHGQGRSHGVSKAHRSLGSTAPGQGGGSRVYPGKKMAGNMGNEQHTLQNSKVLKVDPENGIVVVKGRSSPYLFLMSSLTFGLIGPVSGPKGCMVKIQDAIKKPWPEMKPTETPVAEAESA